MADLATLAGIEAELADTADYAVTLDVSKAKRRAAALRRKLNFPQSTGRGEQNIAFAMQAIENQLQQALEAVSKLLREGDSPIFAPLTILRMAPGAKIGTVPAVLRGAAPGESRRSPRRLFDFPSRSCGSNDAIGHH